jgi:GlpG protein
MYELGTCKDSKVLEELRSALQKANIAHEVVVAPDGLFQVNVHQQEDMIEAIKIYCAIMRLPLPRELQEPQEEVHPFRERIPKGKVTSVLFLASIVIFLISLANPQIKEPLFISRRLDELFFEVQSGQIWRLFTPVLLHFGFIHIIFNMMWLRGLGNLIEVTTNTRFYLFFIALTAIIPNVGQYLVLGPNFGGMSGVVYGFLGYVWMDRKFDPQSPLALPKSDVWMMIIWFFACLFGLLGNIANTAHALGLSLGMIVGIFVAQQRTGKPLVTFNSIRFFLLAVIFSLLTLVIEFVKLNNSYYYQVYPTLNKKELLLAPTDKKEEREI